MMKEGRKDYRKKSLLQLEDAEYASQAAIKAKKTMELELADMQQQIDELFKTKQEVITTERIVYRIAKMKMLSEICTNVKRH